LAESEAFCVYCRRQPTDPVWRPFCSERCRLADLGRWLSEGYRVPDDVPPARPDVIPDGDTDTSDD
jgi:endogenous inhibitor of DNA gyrase (YacG/DUF329 family)